jgi:hypothetical protein
LKQQSKTGANVCGTNFVTTAIGERRENKIIDQLKGNAFRLARGEAHLRSHTPGDVYLKADMWAKPKKMKWKCQFDFCS